MDPCPLIVTLLQHFDTDGSGYISRSELREALAHKNKSAQALARMPSMPRDHQVDDLADDIDDVLAKVDLDQDGKIDYSEVSGMVQLWSVIDTVYAICRYCSGFELHNCCYFYVWHFKLKRLLCFWERLHPCPLSIAVLQDDEGPRRFWQCNLRDGWGQAGHFRHPRGSQEGRGGCEGNQRMSTLGGGVLAVKEISA